LFLIDTVFTGNDAWHEVEGSRLNRFTRD
jgi:hypothetical protein